MAGRPLSEKKGRFPNRVRELRLRAGLTQEELGKKLSLTNSPVAKLERGETRLHLDQINALARVFHCHPMELFLPMSIEERQAMTLLRDATPDMRRRMVEVLKAMADPAPMRAARVA